MIVRYFVLTCENHHEVSICQCGQNTICYSCGEGRGTIPCNCWDGKSIYKSFDEIADDVLTEHKEAWDRLANL